MLDEATVQRVSEAVREYRSEKYPLDARPDNDTDLAAASILTGALEALLWVLEEVPRLSDVGASATNGRSMCDLFAAMNQRAIGKAN